MKKFLVLCSFVFVFMLTACTTVYEVTFYIESGDLVVVEVNDGEFVTPPADPEDEGYGFLGWFVDVDLTTEFDFTEPITDNITIYAGWEYLYTPLTGVVQTVMDSIEAGFSKWYKVTLPEADTLSIYTTGSIDTYGYILDMNEDILYEDDDSFDHELNFQFIEELPAGSYYIVVEGFYDTTEGDYNLEIRELPETETVEPLVDYLDAGMAITYEVEILVAGTYHFYTTGTTDTYGYLLDANEMVLLEDDDRGFGGNYFIIAQCQVGMYYIVTEGFDELEEGNFNLYIEQELD